MAVFDTGDGFADWVSQFNRLHAPVADDLLDWMSSQGSIRCGAAFASMVTDAEFRQLWAVRIWNLDRENLSDALKDLLVDATKKSQPDAHVGARMAVAGWQRCRDLTLAHQRSLRTAFYSRDRVGNLISYPTIEHEIMTRIWEPRTVDADIDRTER